MSGLLQPNTAILVGGLHGTVESPAFVQALACTALSYGFDVNVGLEIPDDETAAVRAFLASDGGPVALSALLAGPFWTAESADGRSSTAILGLLDDFRGRELEGAELNVVLIDSYGATDRDVAMARRVIAAVDATPDAVTITLTGNLHSRGVRGVSCDADYEPMGYLVSQDLGDGAVRTLDVGHSGGSAWTCSEDRTCGPTAFQSNASENVATVPAIKTFAAPNAEGYDGVYFVGALSPATPAIRAADTTG